MFKQILVGVDGTDGGRDAVALAASLRGQDTTLTLAHVLCPEPGDWRGGFDVPPARREGAMRMLEEVRAAAGTGARLNLYDSVHPGRGLHELADALGADLIVTGSSRRGILGRVMVGDDTRRTLDAAPCAVAVAPAGYAPAGYASGPRQLRRIGVGYNASLESEHALAVGRRLASENHAALAACEVIFLPARLWVGLMWPEQASVAEIMAESRARLAQIKGVEPHVTSGDPAEELARFSAGVDLLVIGSRSYGAWGRLAYGSTARELTRLARSPLLVLTRGARVRQREEPVVLEQSSAAPS